jgi:hypothetical protein
VPSASSVNDDEVDRAELTSLGAIVELHPEQTDLVPKTFVRCPVHAELEIERRKWIVNEIFGNNFSGFVRISSVKLIRIGMTD